MDCFCACVLFLFFCLETSVSKKKRVCVRLLPVSQVDTAVLDIKLTAKSKMMLQHYTYVGLVMFTSTVIYLKLVLKLIFSGFPLLLSKEDKLP